MSVPYRFRRIACWVLAAVLLCAQALIPAGQPKLAAAPISAQFTAQRQPSTPAVQPPASAPVLAAGSANTITLAGPADARLTRFRFETATPGRVWATFQTGAIQAGDGMVVSTDGGRHWTSHQSPQRFTNRSYRLGVDYYEVDPTNPNMIYADGMKSIDGGANWLRADSIEGGGAVDAREFAISPANPNILYARNGNSLYRSTNSGASWRSMGAPPSTNNGSILAGMRVDPADAGTLYVFSRGDWGPTSCHSRTNGVHCLSVTRDGGQNWTDIQPRGGTDLNDNPLYALPLDLAVVPGDAGQPSVLYVAAQADWYPDKEGNRVPIGGVLRSVDGGDSWQRLTGLPLQVESSGDTPVLISYTRIVSAQPQKSRPVDRQTLYAVGAADEYTHQLFRSKDGGDSWQEVHPVAVDPRFKQQIVDVAVGAGTAVESAHVVVSAIQRTKANEAIVAFASGTYWSDDNGAGWQEIDASFSNQGFDWVRPGPDGLYAFTAGLGLLFSADGGQNWSIRSDYLMENNVTLNSLAFDRANSQILYAGTSGSARGILRSADGGVTWEGRNLGIGAVDARMLAILPADPPILFAQAGNGLARSTDGGNTWFPIGGSPVLYALHAHPTDAQMLYGQGPGQFGGDTSHLWKSIDGGASWTDLGNNADVFALDPNDPQRLYKSAGPTATANAAYEGIDLSTDGGENWQTLEPGVYGSGRRFLGLLPTEPAILLSVRREISGRTAQPARMDYSNDGGQSWISLGNFATGSPIIAGPVSGEQATFYTQGALFTLGVAPCEICGADVLVQDAYGGLWQYTFDPLPQAPPPPPLVAFSAESYRVAESDGSAAITVTLSAPPLTDVTVAYNTGQGTAIPYQDYDEVNGILTFGPGETVKTFSVPVTADNQPESDETVLLTLSNPQRAGLGPLVDAVLTIVDGGAPPSVRLEQESYIAYERAGRLEVAILLDRAPLEDTYISLTTEDQTAIAGQDYLLDGGGLLLFPAGTTRQILGISVFADGLEELDERFILRLAVAGNVTNGTPSAATITILDERAGWPPLAFLPLIAGGGTGAAPVDIPTAPPSDWPAVEIRASNLPPGVASVIFRVEGMNVPTDLSQQSPPANGTAQATLQAPPGPGRLIRAQAFDGNTALLAEAATLLGIDANTPAVVDLVFGATAAVNCGAVTASAAQAAPGKLLQLEGLGLPADAHLAMLAGGLPAAVVQENGQVIFALPYGLTPGANVPLTLLVNNQPLNCPLPAITVLDLPPAPGESQRVVREMAGLVADLASLAPPAGDGSLPPEALALQALRDTILAQVSTLEAGTGSIPVDGLLAQSGLLGQIQHLRAEMAPALAAAQATSPRAGYAVDRTFVNAKELLDHQDYLSALRQNSVDNPTYKVIKTTVNVFLLTLGIAIAGITALNPGLVIAEIAAASQIISVVSIVWYVAEKVVDLTTRGVYAVEAVHAEIPSPAALLVGELRPWAAGTVDTRRDRIEVKASEVVEYALMVVGGFSNVATILPASAKKALAELLAGLADQLFGAAFTVLDWVSVQPGTWYLSAGEQKELPLGELAVVQVDVAGVVAVRLGAPTGSLQACRAGEVSITVEPDPRLARTNYVEAMKDGFPLVVNQGMARTESPAAVTCPGLATLAGGGQHTLGLTSDGKVIAWGSNSHGQLGHGGNPGTASRQPVTVTGLVSVTAIAAGLDFSLALEEDGTVWAWGRNSDGQLGNQAAGDLRNTPIQVSGLKNILAIAAGERYALAVDRDGRVWAWGLNGYGQLGDGTRVTRRSPVRLPGITGVVAVSAGRTHSLAVDNAGTAWAWGYNAFGQLGDESAEDRLSPVQVHLLGPVKAVSAGGLHSLALTGDGRVYAWGWGKYGQTANGVVNRTYPVWTYLTGAIAIAAGYQHSLALLADGSVWSWGGNGSGQLGQGYTGMVGGVGRIERTGFTAVVGLVTGAYHSLAVTSAGQGWSWGQNISGQLGNELASVSQTTPLVMETQVR